MARQTAAQLLADEAEGKSPAVSRQARKAAELEAAGHTFEALALEWFNTRRGGWEPRTADRTLAALRLHVFQQVGLRPHAEIHPMEWLQLLQTRLPEMR